MKKVKKKLIGIFGGTFDPVHIGHKLVIENLLELIKLDELIVIPNGTPPHKEKRIGETNKLRMTKLALGHIDKVKIDDREIIKETPSYAFLTFKELQKENPNDTLLWIMGSDSYSKIDTWHRYKEFIEEVNLVILSRPDCPIKKDSFAERLLETRKIDDVKGFENQTCKILLLSINPIKLTSTEIRTMISNKNDVSKSLNQDVYKLIKENNLYE
ncbi:MAG: nicotinate (nicotinamide) nucleotide adenylyltransferase [SAR86 cluster bacterium]|nr:nicotinate (nicotinamide) nucleotide adenylyltransferase [SAR86 cluster bacterium]